MKSRAPRLREHRPPDRGKESIKAPRQEREGKLAEVRSWWSGGLRGQRGTAARSVHRLLGFGRSAMY